MAASIQGLVLLLVAGCGPSADDYPFVRPDAQWPDGPIEDPKEQTNVIEHDPLEDWDTRGAGPLSGIFAVEVVARATVAVEVVYRELYRLRILERDGTLRARSQMCRLGLPSVSGVAELEVPLDLELLLRKKDQLFDGLSAAELALPELELLLGAKLTNADDTLPTTESPSAAIDEDADGHPGVTVRATTVLCDAEEAVYVAVRTGATLTAPIDDVDRLSGDVDTRLDFSVLGYSDPCMAAAAGLEVVPLAGATFTAVRTLDEHDIDDNGNITCGEVVAAAPELFGAYWQ